MAAPKRKPTTSQRGYTPKVNKATGRVTGAQTVKKADAASKKIKEYAPRGISPRGSLARAPKGSTAPKAKNKNVLEQVGDFLQSRVDLATGKTRTPISDAMRVTKTGPASWKVKPRGK